MKVRYLTPILLFAVCLMFGSAPHEINAATPVVIDLNPPTETPLPTATASLPTATAPLPTRTDTPTPITPTPINTPTLQPTFTPLPTYTPYPTPVPVIMATPIPAATTVFFTPVPAVTVWPTQTPTPTPAATVWPTKTPTAIPTITNTPIPTSTPDNNNAQSATELINGIPVSDAFEEGGHRIAFYQLSAQANVNHRCSVRSRETDTRLIAIHAGQEIGRNDNETPETIDPMIEWVAFAATERTPVLLIVERMAGHGQFDLRCEAYVPEVTPTAIPIRIVIQPTPIPEPTATATATVTTTVAIAASTESTTTTTSDDPEALATVTPLPTATPVPVVINVSALPIVVTSDPVLAAESSREIQITFFVDVDGDGKPSVDEGIPSMDVIVLNVRGEKINTLRTNRNGVVRWQSAGADSASAPAINWQSNQLTDDTLIEMQSPNIPKSFPGG